MFPVSRMKILGAGSLDLLQLRALEVLFFASTHCCAVCLDAQPLWLQAGQSVVSER